MKCMHLNQNRPNVKETGPEAVSQACQKLGFLAFESSKAFFFAFPKSSINLSSASTHAQSVSVKVVQPSSKLACFS